MDLKITREDAAQLCEKVWPIVITFDKGRRDDGRLLLDEFFDELGAIRYGGKPLPPVPMLDASTMWKGRGRKRGTKAKQ